MSSATPQQQSLIEEGMLRWDDDDPELVVRRSRRARRLTLKVVPPYGLELVVPSRAGGPTIEAFLTAQRGWIRRAVGELKRRYPVEQRGLPKTICLRAVGRTWPVDHTRVAEGRASLRADGDRLTLSMPPGAERAARELLRRWLLRQGREHLIPWLATEARRLGVTPKRVAIKTQRTRWGSCSEAGNVNLNAALLLLPAAQVRYLLVHELCHLRHLDHSARYWRLVERYEPEYRTLDRALAVAWSELPAWALSR